MSELEKWEEELTETGFWFIYICICLAILGCVWALFSWVLK